MTFKKGEKNWMKRKDRQAKIQVKEIGIIPAISPAEQKDTMRRHTVGMMSAVETLWGPVFTPKCKTCYDKHGWLTKCNCQKTS